MNDKLLVHFSDLVALNTHDGSEAWRAKISPGHGTAMHARLGNVDVAIHPSGNVYRVSDGSILAHMGVTDMTLPIQYALTWPDRATSPMARLDLTSMKDITFDAPDFTQFPCLAHALDAARAGGTAGAVLNAANEVAVEAFRQHEIPFLSIASVVGGVLDKADIQADFTLESVLDADAEARDLVHTELRQPGNGVGLSSSMHVSATRLDGLHGGRASRQSRDSR